MEVLNVGQRIRKIRIEKNLKLKDIVGNELSLTKLSFIENSKIQPSAKELSYIAEKLGVKSTELNIPIKKQLRDYYNNISRSYGSIDDIRKLIKLAESYGESDMSFEFLTEYTLLMILNSSQEEIIEVLPDIFRNVISGYSDNKMSEYLFVVSNYLTNCKEHATSLFFLKYMFSLIQGENNIVKNLPVFYNCYLRSHIMAMNVKEAGKMAECIYNMLNDIENEQIKAESLFLIKAYTMMSGEEVKFTLDKEDAQEGLLKYPFRLSENYILLSDISFEKGNLREGTRYLNKAESAAERNSETQSLMLLDVIIHKFIKHELYNDAEKHIDSYMIKAQHSGIIAHIEKSYWYKALVCFKRKDMQNAEAFLTLSLDGLKKLGDENKIRQRYRDLSDFYYRTGNYRKSIEALRHTGIRCQI